MDRMMNFMDSVAGRFDTALENRPFTTAVKCYATGSLLVAVAALSVSLIASSSIIAVPAAVISITAGYVFYKILATAHHVHSNELNRVMARLSPRLLEEASLLVFNHTMKKDFVVSGLIKIKNFIS